MYDVVNGKAMARYKTYKGSRARLNGSRKTMTPFKHGIFMLAKVPRHYNLTEVT